MSQARSPPRNGGGNWLQMSILQYPFIPQAKGFCSPLLSISLSWFFFFCHSFTCSPEGKTGWCPLKSQKKPGWRVRWKEGGDRIPETRLIHSHTHTPHTLTTCTHRHTRQVVLIVVLSILIPFLNGIRDIDFATLQRRKHQHISVSRSIDTQEQQKFLYSHNFLSILHGKRGIRRS